MYLEDVGIKAWKALASFIIPYCLWEGILPCFYIPSLIPIIELVLEIFLWLDVMFGLGLLSQTTRAARTGLGPWGINLTNFLDPSWACVWLMKICNSLTVWEQLFYSQWLIVQPNPWLIFPSLSLLTETITNVGLKNCSCFLNSSTSIMFCLRIVLLLFIPQVIHPLLLLLLLLSIIRMKF